MDMELAVSVAAGIVGAAVVISVGKLALTDGVTTVRRLFTAEDRQRIYGFLGAFVIWGVIAVSLSVDFRPSGTHAVYVALGLCGLFVLAALLILKLRFEATYGFGKYGTAFDVLSYLWGGLALVIGAISAINAARLISYLWDGSWFSWLLS